MLQNGNYRVYCGFNDKETKTQLHPSAWYIETAANYCAANFVGATIESAKGVYKHADGSTVIEETAVITLVGVTDSETRALAAWLKETFNQESVMVEETSAKFTFE